MKKFVLSLFLLISLSAWAQAQKTFNGDLLIRSLSDMEEFIAEGYTKVNGNLTVDQGSPGLSNSEGVLQVYPNGLKSLKEVTGDLILKRGFFAAPPITLLRLRTVGGSLELNSLETVNFPQLRTIGGSFERIFTSGGELRIPRLESVNGDFELRGVPDLLSSNRLRQVSGDMTITNFFNPNGIETLSFSQLNRVDGSISIGGATDNTGPFKRLHVPRLKSVGGDFYVKFSWETFEKQNFSSLEQVVNLTIEGGGYINAPRLREVTGDFKHIVRTLLDGQRMELSYPSLTAVRGNFDYEAQGVNDERITLDKVNLPSLTFVDEFDINTGYEVASINLEKLQEANSIDLRTMR